MLRHIVFFSVTHSDDLDRVQKMLSNLATIPTVKHLEVRRNIRRDQLSSEVDLVVYGEFEDEAALEAYKAHPTYAETTRLVRPLRDIRIAADVKAQAES